MKLWIDDMRPAPEGYIWAKSVDDAISTIMNCEYMIENSFRYAYKQLEMIDYYTIELIDIDHDAGNYACDGGDYIKLLDWLEETGRNYPIRIHSMNVVGVQNMRTIIQRNGWTEVK